MPFAICLLLFAIRSGQDQTVRFECPATRLELLLPRLSASAGVTLTASPELKDEPFVVRVDGQARSEVMNEIALAACGSWEKTSIGFVLRENRKLFDVRRAQQVSKRETAIRKAVLEFTKPLTMTPVFDESAAAALQHDLETGDHIELIPGEPGYSSAAVEAHAAMFTRAPLNRALMRALKLISLFELALIPQGQVRVFSNDPKPLELPIRGDASELLASLSMEEKAWASRPAPAANAPRLSDLPRTDPRRIGTLGDEPPVRIVARIANMGEWDEILFFVLDRAGQTLANIRYVLEFGQKNSAATRALEDARVLEKPTYSLSPDALAMLRRKKLDFAMPNPPPVSPGLKERLLHPELHDPLALAPSECLLEISRRRKAPLVACVADDVMEMPQWLERKGQLNLDRYWDWGLNRTEETPPDATGNWLVLRSRLTGTGEVPKRIDRPALGQALRALDDKGWLSLEDLGQFAQSSQAQLDGREPVFVDCVAAIAPRAECLLPENDWPMLKAYGALSGDVQQNLRAGGRIHFAPPPEAPKEALAEMTRLPEYGAMFTARIEQEEEWAMNTGSVDALGLLPEAIDAGLDTPMTFTGAEQKLPWLCVTQSGRVAPSGRIVPPFAVSMDALNIGHMRAPETSRVWTGSAIDFTLRIALSPTVTLKGVLRENRFDMRSPPVELTALPPDIQKELSAGRKNPLNPHGTPPPG